MRAPVEGAGGVVVNPEGQVLLIRYPKARGGAWTFPKGHLEPGESLEAAAVREVMEEGGVAARLLARLEPTRYVNARGVPRLVHWFLMRTEATLARGEPGFKAAFYPPGEAEVRLTHPHDKATLAAALALEVGA